MQKTSKVISTKFVREFSGQKGTMYVHNVVFENGDNGEYNSNSKDQTKFVVGQDTAYDISSKTRKHNGKTYTDVMIKPIYADNRNGYKKKELSPEEQLRISKQVGIECALLTLKLIDKSLVKKGNQYTIANKYAEWMVAKTNDKTFDNAGMMCSKSLREAINTIPHDALYTKKNSLVETILEIADEIYNYFTV